MSEATALTGCSPGPPHSARAGGQAVVADFHGGRLTADSGALLPRELGRRTGLFDALGRRIPDPRRPS